MRLQKMAKWLLMVLLTIEAVAKCSASGAILSLQSSSPLFNAAGVDATATGIAPNTGTFTISRGGTLTSAVTVQLGISGTAVPGVDYVALPTNITLAANVVSSNLTVQLQTNATISTPK